MCVLSVGQRLAQHWHVCAFAHYRNSSGLMCMCSEITTTVWLMLWRAVICCTSSPLPADLNGPEYVGTAEYMAPEIVKGLVANCDADLWSFGNIVYQLLHGK